MRRYIFLLFMFFVGIACQESKKRTLIENLNDWQGKIIVLPDSILLTSYRKDTTLTKYLNNRSTYTILNYVDTLGCISCRLQLSRWKYLMNEIHKKYPDSVNCLMVFYSNHKKNFIKILRNNDFDEFVFMDDTDTLNKMNRFLHNETFRTFLLDKYNKVLAIGNPVINPYVRNLYLSILSGNDISIDNRQCILSEMYLSKTLIDWGDFSYEEKREVEIEITNIGVNVLSIDDIIPSCQCIKVDWSQKTLRVGESIMLKISYQGITPELLNENISIICNVPDSPVRIRVIGNAK